MEFRFSEEQEIIKKSVRIFFEEQCSIDKVKKFLQSDRGYSSELYKELADLGFLGITIPEEFGGSGGSLLDLVILYKEIGRSLFPSPHFDTVVLSSYLINKYGNDEQKKLLSKIAKGEVTISFAHLDDEQLPVKTAVVDDKIIVNGRKLFVNFANSCNYYLLSNRGITVLIESSKGGISLEPISVIGLEKSFSVSFYNVEVDKSNVIKGDSDIFDDVWQRGKILSSAEMIGGAERVLEWAIEYAKQRIQFGRPIGSFQAIQHMLSDVAMNIEGANLLLYESCWAYDNNKNFEELASMSKFWANKVYYQATKTTHQVLGGFGFMEETNMHLYYRKAKSLEINRGKTCEEVENIIK